MSNEDNIVIQPQAAPLSHLEQPHSRLNLSFDWRNTAVVVAVISIAIAIAYLQPWDGAAVEVKLDTESNPEQSTADSTVSRNSDETESLPPFAATQQAMARDKAQAALANFVEKQIKLEETLKVQEWGQVPYESALAGAKQGDIEFVQAQFDAALVSYTEANAALDAVIAMADEVFQTHIADTRVAIDALDTVAATKAVTQALKLKPGDTTALALQQRVATLPKVTALLRTARNHELGGRTDAALETYQAVRQLDPATASLQSRLEQVSRLEQQQQVATFISRGFDALEQGQFNAARQAFNKALAVEPDNDIAQGGIQQVQAEFDVDQIKGLQRKANAAMDSEDWPKAIQTFEEIQALDDKIQFAVTGLINARAHQKAHTILTKIVAEPHRLSSEKLFFEARNIVESSKTLSHQGPQLSGLTARAEELLTLYKDPVDVLLLSDNATDIVVSNVGRLGFFDEKTLSLRPGTYTIRGSQNGCRDLYLSIEILPGIEPLDLSCPERLAISR